MTKQTYEKPWLSVEAQVRLLQVRGMRVSDVAAAEQYLTHTSYYRLSGYWYPFRLRIKGANGPIRRQRTDEFWPGTTFNDVIEIYEFDRQLRNLILEAIERLEVTLRCHISRALGFFGPEAYAKETKLFRESFLVKKPNKEGKIESSFDRWMKKNSELLDRSNQDLARFAREKYKSPHPIWVITETWDLGQTIWALEGLNPQLRGYVASSFGIENGDVFHACWVTLGRLRNAAAHQCRVWNASLPKIGGLSDTPEYKWANYYDVRTGGRQGKLGRVGASLLVMTEFLRATSQDLGWSARLGLLLESFPHTRCGDMQFEGLGLPPDWRDVLAGNPP